MIIARGCWRESVLRAAADSSHRLAAESLPFHLDFLTSSLPFAAEPESKKMSYFENAEFRYICIYTSRHYLGPDFN